MGLTPTRSLRLFLAIAVLAGATAAVSSAATPDASRGALTGKWTGTLSGSVNGTTRKERITLVVYPRQTAGTWRVSASCHGRLTLDSISDGSHHFLRHLARGGSCHGGDIDCLWPRSGKIYDNVTPRPGGWSRDGTLHRVLRR